MQKRKNPTIPKPTSLEQDAMNTEQMSSLAAADGSFPNVARALSQLARKRRATADASNPKRIGPPTPR